MSQRVKQAGLQIAKPLYDLVENEIAPGTGISSDKFWTAFAKIWLELGSLNQELLTERDDLQTKIDDWHKSKPGNDNFASYKKFLRKIGYLLPEGEPFRVSLENVDPEISSIAGPQLVVPVNNARFALNAANARWGSLYDSLYGTDVIDDSDGGEAGTDYNPVRGERVVQYAAKFLDQAIPLQQGSHADVASYWLSGNGMLGMSVTLSDGSSTGLVKREQLVGYQGAKDSPSAIILRNNGLHIELLIDPEDPIGKVSESGLKDVFLESAVTTILDFEDSVTAVDAQDKVDAYRNWLGLIKGKLEATFVKGGRELTRTLEPDREYIGINGDRVIIPGRSLLLVRNVGHLMTIDAVLDEDGNEVPEGILDAMMTTFCALHDLAGDYKGGNSRAGSIYIVKPKMHGPKEVAFTNELFGRVENGLGLPFNTLKVGLMDEERRTTINLKESIRSVRERLVFINTGFLDRTGDEIHTSMEAGAFLPKEEIKSQPWIAAYENWNVDIGLECGLSGKAQIGKGMWAKPDNMKEMMATKGCHPAAGANCAWVPSPTAATLHAMHYHNLDVLQRHQELFVRDRASLDDILTIPLLQRELTAQEIQHDLDNNIQGILGYVVRWIDQAIGCSKVPDIDNVGLMEDRATLRISSQHIANWLHHGLCDEKQIMQSMQRMAVIVDQQNAGDDAYQAMAPNFHDSIAFKTACELVFSGREQPNGYTEPVLHRRRLEAKARHG